MRGECAQDEAINDKSKKTTRQWHEDESNQISEGVSLVVSRGINPLLVAAVVVSTGWVPERRGWKEATRSQQTASSSP